MKKTNRINILFISSRADHGGGQAQMFDIISGLDRERFRAFAALPDEKPFYPKLARAGVSMLAIKKRSFSPADLWRLIFFVRDNSIDIIHSHGKGAGVYSRLLKIFNPKVKIAHTFHGFHFDTLGPSGRYLYIALERAFAHLTDRFINVSESERREYIERGITDEDNSAVIVNRLSKETAARIARAIQGPKFSAGAGTVFFCNVSRFDEVKEIPFLIEAFAGASSSNDKLKLMLVGDGDEFDKCRGIAAGLNVKNKVCFLGFRDDALEMMARCDIYVSASRREGMPLSMIEAAGAGLPLLASRVPGHVDIVSGNPGGFFFEYNDAASFKKAFDDVLAFRSSNPSTAPFKTFSPYEAQDEKYMRFYEELAAF